VASAAALLVSGGLALAGCGGDTGGRGATPAADTPQPAAPATTAEHAASVAATAAGPPSPAPPLAPEPLEAARCELATYASQLPLPDGSIHVEQLPDGFSFNSVPASQGPHHPRWTAAFGVHAEPVDELLTVHSLEHGGVSVQFGAAVPDSTIEQILAWYDEDPNGLIVAPYPALGAEVALAAWVADPEPGVGADALYRGSVGKVLRCDGFDRAQFDAFRRDYRGRGPEPIPVEEMTPGT
jgi:hypothetical protein